MAVDLHTHSTASDGSETPTAVVGQAVRSGLSAIALTDHETQDGIEEARTAADAAGIEFVPGAELACEWDRGGLHLVVLFLEPGPGPLQDRFVEFRAGRNRRNQAIARRLASAGIDISYEEVLAQAGEGSVGRPHFAAILVAKGYVPDIPTAFREYLGAGGAAYATRPLPTPAEAIKLARRSGGVPVVAHPHTLGLNTSDEYAAAFRLLAGYGLVGVECYYGEYPPETRRKLEATVRSFGLLPSGGSDFHGSYKPGLRVGIGRGDLEVPDRILDELRAARGT